MEEIQEVKWTSTPTEMTSKMETESCTAPALETNENRKVDRKRFFFLKSTAIPFKREAVGRSDCWHRLAPIIELLFRHGVYHALVDAK